jgi:hypothetical protein
MGILSITLRAHWRDLPAPDLGMPDLATEIGDPRKRPAGNQGEDEIEHDQSSGERPAFPSTHQGEQRHRSDDPAGHKSELSSLLVTVEVRLPGADRSFNRLFRSLPG